MRRSGHKRLSLFACIVCRRTSQTVVLSLLQRRRNAEAIEVRKLS